MTAVARGKLWWATPLPADQLSPFAPTIVPLEIQLMLGAARHMLEIYRGLAQPLAAEHGITYPLALERLMLGRFESLTTRS